MPTRRTRFSKGPSQRDLLAAARSTEKEVVRLERMYDGTNGFPKFDVGGVMRHAVKFRILNLHFAYLRRHRRAIRSAIIKNAHPLAPARDAP